MSVLMSLNAEQCKLNCIVPAGPLYRSIIDLTAHKNMKLKRVSENNLDTKQDVRVSLQKPDVMAQIRGF